MVSILVLGVLFESVRKASWPILLVFSLGMITLDPTQVAGSLGAFASVYAMIHAGWIPAGRIIWTVALATAIVSAQIASLVLQPKSWLPILGTALTADLVMAYLVAIFQDHLLDREQKEAPLLDLSEIGLSVREVQVLHLFWGGQSSKEISSILGFADITIRKDLASLYRKIGVAGAKELFIISHTHRVVLEPSG